MFWWRGTSLNGFGKGAPKAARRVANSSVRCVAHTLVVKEGAFLHNYNQVVLISRVGLDVPDTI